MNTTTDNCDLINKFTPESMAEIAAIHDIVDENRNLKDVLIQCVMALNVAQKALAHCKADVGYSSKQTKAAIEINAAINKYNELVQQ